MITLTPWLQDAQREVLAQRGHALLLQGPPGLGQYELALSVAAAWLCESRPADAPLQAACGHCPSCHAIEVRTHADLAVLMPEVTQLALGWPLPEKIQQELDDKKRKPSKDIRIESVRETVEFCQRTDARGRGKVVLVYPAERLNAASANALLKTLEEPTGAVRFVLATEALQQLMPTLRSRCQSYKMPWPDRPAALQWLESMDLPLADASPLLDLAGGRPAEALRLHREGQTLAWWRVLSAALRQGDAQPLLDMPPPQLLEALQKLCLDLCLRQVGAPLRYFASLGLPECQASLMSLTAWQQRLRQSARTAEHPFNAGLMIEALVADARQVLAGRT